MQIFVQLHEALSNCWVFRVKDNETRRTRALKKAEDNQEMCKVRDKEIERQVTDTEPWGAIRTGTVAPANIWLLR